MECLWQLTGLVAFFFRTDYVGWLFYLNADCGVYLESFIIAIMHLQTIKVFLTDHDITTKGGLVKGSNAIAATSDTTFSTSLLDLIHLLVLLE